MYDIEEFQDTFDIKKKDLSLKLGVKIDLTTILFTFNILEINYESRIVVVDDSNMCKYLGQIYIISVSWW